MSITKAKNPKSLMKFLIRKKSISEFSINQFLEYYHGYNAQVREDSHFGSKKNPKTCCKNYGYKNKFNKWNSNYFNYRLNHMNGANQYEHLSITQNNFVHKLGGMIVHSVIGIFVKQSLREISINLGMYPNNFQVMSQLKFEAVQSILTIYDKFEKKNPEIEKFKEEILSYVKKAIEGFVSIFYQEYKSNKQKQGNLFDFEQFITEYMPLFQEKSMSVEHNGAIIYFKPDLIRFKDGELVLIDFKTGNYSPNRLKKDEDQIISFAWCFELESGYKVDRCEIHYLSHKKIIPVSYTEQDINHIVKKINLFIHRKINRNTRPSNTKRIKRDHLIIQNNEK